MIKAEVLEKVDPEWWNGLVKSVPEGTIFQTTYWADYLKESGKSQPYYLSFYHNSKTPICILLIYLENNWYKFERTPQFIKDICKFNYATWVYGPLILQEGLSYAILKQIVDEVEQICIKINVIAIRNITLPLTYIKTIDEYNILENILTKNNFYHKKWETPFIDLTSGREVIWSSFKKYTRKDIKHGFRSDLDVTDLKREDMEKYEHLLAENMKRNKMIMPPHYPDNIMWDNLKGNGYDALRVLAVKKGSYILGALGLIEYNGIIFQIGSAQSDDAYFKKLNINDIITWEAILWGINNKKLIYDLTGIAPIPSDKSEEGIRQYKLKWSNRTIIYNMYSKIYRQNLHAILIASSRVYNTVTKWI